MSCTRRFLTSRNAIMKSAGLSGALAFAITFLLGVLNATPAAAQTILPDATCPGNLTECTANDLTTKVVAAAPVGEDTCTGPEDTILLEFTIEFDATSAEKYDVGFFVSRDGGSVKEPSDAEQCAGAAPKFDDGDANAFPIDADSDLFLNLDPNHPPDPADTCGDLKKTAGPVRWTVQAEVSCKVDANGDLTVPSCRVWEQNKNHDGTCTNLGDAGTGSKCDCTDLSFAGVLDPCVTAFCDDGDSCNGVESCDSGGGPAVCLDGDDVICDDGVACTVDSCNEETDSCDFVPNSAFCDNGQFCDGSETCDPEKDCQGGTAPVCSDGVDCTDDLCDKEANGGAGACAATANDANCDDGEFCNGNEACDPVNDCQAGTPPRTDDGVSCTDDSCDEVNDDIDHVPNDGRCDNGQFCDGSETCDPEKDCQGGTAPVCSDGVDCTDDLCDKEANGGAGACAATANDANCDDGASCSTDECKPGDQNADADGCVVTPVDGNCNDGASCSTDECKPGDQSADAGGCVVTPVDGNCDDGVSCSTDECKPGDQNADADGCVVAPVDDNCDDGASCSTDECKPGDQNADADGCVVTPVDGNCDDGASCSTDACEPGDPSAGLDGCVVTPVDANCEDGDDCTDQLCDPGDSNADPDGCVITCDPTNDENKCFVKIGDFIWNDDDEDGIQDGEEIGIPNVELELLFCADGEVSALADIPPVTTAMNGTYNLELPTCSAESLAVQVSAGNFGPGGALEGYFTTLPDQGFNDALDSDVDLLTLQTDCRVITRGTTDDDVDGGFFQPGDICRTHGFWGNHPPATAELLTVADPMICGAPAVTQLGCAMEGLCISPKGNKQLITARQLLTASLNCIITNGNADCVGTGIQDLFESCNMACADNDAAAMALCEPKVDCFNNGGEWVDGLGCALGTCSADSLRCGGNAGACAPVYDQQGNNINVCGPFPGNCHDQPLVNDALGISIEQSPADSAMCKAASKSSGTIFICTP